MAGSVEKEVEKEAIVCLFGPTNKAPEGFFLAEPRL